jgi:chitin synthase
MGIIHKSALCSIIGHTTKPVACAAIAAQATGFVVWPIIEQRADLWIIPIAIFLVSLGWWENYISKYSPIPFVKKLGKIKESLEQSRYFTYMFISRWK